VKVIFYSGGEEVGGSREQEVGRRKGQIKWCQFAG